MLSLPKHRPPRAVLRECQVLGGHRLVEKRRPASMCSAPQMDGVGVIVWRERTLEGRLARTILSGCPYQDICREVQPGHPDRMVLVCMCFIVFDVLCSCFPEF